MTFVKQNKRKIIMVLAVTMGLLVGGIIYSNTNRLSDIERKLVAAIDQYCEEEGECDIDLAEVFGEFEWDTVSIFVAGDTAEVMDLGVYTEISDGIVFSREGQPLKKHLSCYGFPEDIPPLVSYYVEQTNLYSPHYISLPREQAIVHAEKYRFRDGSYRYNIVARNPS